jgi:DNA-binding MarR family transcriptional regulator
MSIPERPDLAQRLTFVVGTINRRLRPPADGLSHIAVSALSSISRAGSIRPGDLARVEGIAAPGMTRLVADLEHRGLVERSADAHDRRSTLIRLTAAGEQELLAARESRSAWVAGLLAGLPAADLDAVEQAVAALESALFDQAPGAPARSVQAV